MSVIADALLFISMRDDVGLLSMHALLNESSRGQEFRRINTDHAGGSKFFCAEVWAGAFNYVDPGAISDAVAKAQWRYPDQVVLVMDAYDYGDDLPWAKTVVQLREGAES